MEDGLTILVLGAAAEVAIVVRYGLGAGDGHGLAIGVGDEILQCVTKYLRELLYR